MYVIYLMMDHIRSKHIVEEAAVIHDKVAHHQSVNTARSCTSNAAPVN
jgi:hypothetical protein